MKHMCCIIHLKLVNDSTVARVIARVSWLEFSIYIFNFCSFRALAYATLDKLWVVFLFLICSNHRSKMHRVSYGHKMDERTPACAKAPYWGGRGIMDSEQLSLHWLVNVQ